MYLTIDEILDNEVIDKSLPTDLLNLLLIFFDQEDWEEIGEFLNAKLDKSKVTFRSITFVYLMFLLDTLWEDFEKFDESDKTDLEFPPINFN
ncbi:MAG: hypothetical protein KJ571_11545 [Bacteroidetes bacterium]|nr:hypothetical protein [Bacteroidota bacterium]